MTSYPAAPSATAYHARGVIDSGIGGHPMAAAAIIGVLVVLAIILIYYVIHYRAQANALTAAAAAATKSGFAGGIRSANNLTMGGTNPMWTGGSGHAGAGGDIDRAETAEHMAVFTPSLRRSDAVESAHMHHVPGHPMRCGGSRWNHEASAEARSLVAMGGLRHTDTYGESALDRAAGGAEGGMSDEALMSVMHQGGGST